MTQKSRGTGLKIQSFAFRALSIIYRKFNAIKYKERGVICNFNINGRKKFKKSSTTRGNLYFTSLVQDIDITITLIYPYSPDMQRGVICA
jgi:hypothetical protein